jgi:tRNA(Arg) A34 adenosine deaminase TadA
MTIHEQFMQIAIDKARQGIAEGQTPFGACLVRQGEVICATHNHVWKTTDITAHAEMQLLRDACRILGTIDLSGCELYTTCEPCPMCFSASHWSRVDRLYYGASIADACEAGFNELCIAADDMKRYGGSSLVVTGGILVDEAKALFVYWKSKADAKAY